MKATTIKSIFLAFCMVFLYSCHSGNKVVSTYGKRKYTKGWFLFKHKSVDTKGVKGDDNGLTHKFPAINKQEQPATTEAPKEQEQSRQEKRMLRHARKDSITAAKRAKKEEIAKQKKDKNKINTPKPPDDYALRLLIMIIVLTAFSILFTGLITPIAVWSITQNFLLAAGVALSFLALFVSVNTKLGINLQHKEGADNQYNLGKPSLVLSIWGTGLMAFVYAIARSSAEANLLAIEIATVGLFAAGSCVLLSLILGVKALFVNDRHPGKAVMAIIIDALLITAGILLF